MFHSSGRVSRAISALPSGVFVLFLTFAAPPAAAQQSQGRVAVSHDEWPTTDLGFALAPTGVAATFALNIAEWFTGGPPGNFLVYSNNIAYTQSQMTATMAGAGHVWTIWSPGLGVSITAAGLQPYDAVFLGGQLPGGGATPTAELAAYVQGGGGLYLACGTGPGQYPSAAAEAAAWNPLLAGFGMQLQSSYNTLMGVFATAYAHPMFSSVPSLYCHFGNSVAPTGPNPATMIFSTAGEGLFGFYDPPFFQVNQPQAGLVVNGVTGRAHFPPPPGGASGTVDVSSTLVGALWDLAITIPDPLLPVGGGGFALLDGQVVNLNLASSGFLFLFGGFAVGGFPGSFSFPYSLPPGSPAISSQLVLFDATSPTGLRLSAPARIEP
jgi:hypothetical protein